MSSFCVFMGKLKKEKIYNFHVFLRSKMPLFQRSFVPYFFPFVNSPANGGGILAVMIICLQPPLMEDSFYSENLEGMEQKALRFGKLEIRLPFTFDEFASKKRGWLEMRKLIHVTNYHEKTSS